MFSNWWMFNTFVESQLLYELSNYKSAQQDADDRDKELDLEESLGKKLSLKDSYTKSQTGVWDR